MKKIMIVITLLVSASMYSSEREDSPRYLKHRYASNEKKPRLMPTREELLVVATYYPTSEYGMPVEVTIINENDGAE